jgi:hypothetical protein
MRKIIQKTMLALFIVQEKTDERGIKRHKFVVWNPLSHIFIILALIGVMIYGAFEALFETVNYNPFKWT